ncbi:MAG: hypothetical protein ACXIU7_07375, partial [Roseinatronobacter sp.]
TATPRSVTSFTASNLNSFVNFRLTMSDLRSLGHDLIFVSTKPAAGHPASIGPKALFHPPSPERTYPPKETKKTKQSHGRISNCARSARACLASGPVAGAEKGVILILSRHS